MNLVVSKIAAEAEVVSAKVVVNTPLEQIDWKQLVLAILGGGGGNNKILNSLKIDLSSEVIHRVFFLFFGILSKRLTTKGRIN